MSLLVIFACLHTALASPTTAGEFAVRDGDKFVIYGDSITDHAYYPRVIENYVLTRFPQWKVTFYNLGWGGDVAHNHFRLQRDVLPLKPDLITSNMGMNDGSYTLISHGIVNRYSNAYRKNIKMLRQANPDVRIILVSAIPFENRGARDRANGAYAQTLGVLSDVKHRMAMEMNTGYVDLFSRYATSMGKGKVIYPDFFLSGDGVHPNVIGQSIMGLEILKGMGAPAEIATLKLNADTSKATETFRCKIRNFTAATDGSITFERLAEALPCPIEARGAKAKRFLAVVGLSKRLNRDMLFVSGLKAPAYNISIGKTVIGTYTPLELANGVNVAEPMTGPLWDQARAVMAATNRRQNAHYTKWREVWLANGSSRAGQYDLANKEAATYEAAEAAAIKQQHELNKPKWVTFTLTPTKAKVYELPKPVTHDNVSAKNRPSMLKKINWDGKPVIYVDLSKVVNRGFADAKAGDGKGGWSDQGPSNDLGSFPTGQQVLNGIPFSVIHPSQNAGKSMLVLSGRKGLKAPIKAVIPINAKAKTLALLQTGAWANKGKIKLTITYAGGIQIEKTMHVGVHLSDWWGPPISLPAAYRAWKGRNSRGNGIGAYYSPIINPNPAATIESLTLEVPAGQQVVYGLMAITALK